MSDKIKNFTFEPQKGEIKKINDDFTLYLREKKLIELNRKLT